jgi:translocator protein
MTTTPSTGAADTRSARPGRADRADRIRAGAVLVGAVLQIVVGALGGSGAFGLSVGQVAQNSPTPVMPASTAFSIWSLVYAAILALAIRQALPSQLARPVHRATGWWLVAASVFNAGWILVFSSQLVVVSQLVIVALLATLALVLARLTAHPAAGAADRLLLHGPVALYTGWVSLATVVGFATTGASLGIDSSGALGTILGTVVLLVVAAIAGWVTARAAGAVPYAAAVVWALFFIVVMGPPLPVLLAALIALATVVTIATRRVVAARRGTRIAAAFG